MPTDSKKYKVAYIAAGAANMICGSCVRDNALAAALSRMGHDVALIPTYTPIRTDETNVSIDRVFYNGINVYLEQKFRMFRSGGKFLEKLLDNSGLINLVSKFSASTDAKDLGELTVSVLRGEEGNQRKELFKAGGMAKRRLPAGDCQDHQFDVSRTCKGNKTGAGRAGSVRDARRRHFFRGSGRALQNRSAHIDSLACKRC